MRIPANVRGTRDPVGFQRRRQALSAFILSYLHLYRPRRHCLGNECEFPFSRNIRASQTALWLSWPILTLLSVTTCFSGLAIYSKYHDCDPIRQRRITSPDMLMPLYVMDTMSEMPGLPGLFIAGERMTTIPDDDRSV